MRSFAILCCLMTLGGCIQTGLAPSEQVVPECSSREFGFVGEWSEVPDPAYAQRAPNDKYVISRDAGHYKLDLVEFSGGGKKNLIGQFRTHEISMNLPHAVIDFEMDIHSKGTVRRLAIGAVGDDGRLYIWFIDGKKVGKHLHENGVNAVLEHFSTSTTVRCEPKDLLAVIAAHSREIVMESHVYERINHKDR